MASDNKLFCCCIIALSLYRLAVPAHAQNAVPGEPQGQDLAPIEEIIVTARRISENLQEVPSSINVATAKNIEDLKLTEFTDLESIVPGLTLAQDGSGTQTAASLRGVSFDASTTAPPTVAMYLNDAPVQSLYLYDSLFDVAQIEVLRGPQGTTRGISAPSGAITVTTQKPTLDQWGGFARGLMTDREAHNLQAGVNVPVVQNTLALRIAGLADVTEANSVESLNKSKDPEQKTRAGRLSVLYDATQNLTLDASYMHIDKTLQSFEQVSGPGQGTASNPAIRAGQHMSVQDEISDVDVDLDILTLTANFAMASHNLTYVGSYQDAGTYALSDSDAGDILPGAAIPFLTTSSKEEFTHEIRLTSNPDSGMRFNYTAGLFYDRAETAADVSNPGPLLFGAFGSPANGINLDAFNPRYQIPIFVDIDYLSEEMSAFASGTLQLGPSTELSAGLRYIRSKFNSDLLTSLGEGTAAVFTTVLGISSCEAAMLESFYPGYCDYIIPGSDLPENKFRSEESPTIYNIALSHFLHEDLMLYASTGTAYRPPIASPGIQGDLAGHPNPALNTLTFHPYETSTNYEAGFKWTTWEGRARLNATAFYQEFEDLTTYVPNITYFNTASGQTSTANFTASVDAEVSGFEFDAAASLGDFDLSAQISYANGDVDDSLVPCNITQNGAPVFNTEDLISLCPGGSVSREPLWAGNLQANYSFSVGDRMGAYVRALVSYKAENKNLGEGFVVDDYAITNLYLGLRGRSDAWEIAAFVRNLFDTEQALEQSSNAYDLNTSLGTAYPQLIPASGSGYYPTRVTRPREVGVSISYAWGSR